LPTRSILDSVLSAIVGLETNTFTIVSDTVEKEYINNFQATKFNIDLDKFKDMVDHFNSLYCEAFDNFDQHTGEKYILKYHIHATNYNMFYSALKINCCWEDLPDFKWVNTPMPIDKFLMINNLKEVLDIYKLMDLDYDFNDQQTIDKIQEIINE
jgi:hypothetical protein